MITDHGKATRPVSILVVEDESVVALDLKEHLQEMGYSVCAIASSGDEAIALTQEHRPDLILMDVVIRGGMDGIEAATHVARERPIPVIYLTAFGDESTIGRALHTAPYGFLTKPFHPTNLRAAIEVALYRAQWDERERERTAQLESLVQIDSLTGVANRRRLAELGQRELARSARIGAPLAVLFIDIDHFKRINDGFGHEAGDAVLLSFAKVCGGLLREIDVFGRFGGEEFVAILPDTDLATSLQVAERVRQVVSDLRVRLEDGQELRITVSVGACERRPEETMEELLRRADLAMYQAKQGGRDLVRS